MPAQQAFLPNTIPLHFAVQTKCEPLGKYPHRVTPKDTDGGQIAPSLPTPLLPRSVAHPQHEHEHPPSVKVTNPWAWHQTPKQSVSATSGNAAHWLLFAYASHTRRMQAINQTTIQISIIILIGTVGIA